MHTFPVLLESHDHQTDCMFVLVELLLLPLVGSIFAMFHDTNITRMDFLNALRI